MDKLTEQRAWLEANKQRITHFRPRRWCGQEMLIAYDRSQAVPYIDGQPAFVDDNATFALIREVCGPGKCEDPFH